MTDGQSDACRNQILTSPGSKGMRTGIRGADVNFEIMRHCKNRCGAQVERAYPYSYCPRCIRAGFGRDELGDGHRCLACNEVMPLERRGLCDACAAEVRNPKHRFRGIK